MRNKSGAEISSRTKTVETIVFVPTTPGSRLRISLQDADDKLVSSINSPSVQFVERGGPILMETVGNNNPDSKEWYCGRIDCAPCQGGEQLGAEAEEQSLKIAEDQDVITFNPEDKRTLPSCTGEGIDYSIEC